MENRGNTQKTCIGNAVRKGFPALALALLVTLPVSTAVTVQGGPSVQLSVNGWQ
ncbi:hypothetical protein [Streptomyces spinoverrucosus]|nr:hypothetical protein [Streptomyces spinoverrucosus]